MLITPALNGVRCRISSSGSGEEVGCRERRWRGKGGGREEERKEREEGGVVAIVGEDAGRQAEQVKKEGERQKRKKLYGVLEYFRVCVLKIWNIFKRFL